MRLFERDSRNLTPSLSSCGSGNGRSRPRLARLIQAIADGRGSQSITAAIGEREREPRSIIDKLLEPRPGIIALQH